MFLLYYIIIMRISDVDLVYIIYLILLLLLGLMGNAYIGGSYYIMYCIPHKYK